MSETTTVARPYAKAVFQLALETKTLAQWSTCLHQLSLVMTVCEMKRFIQSPTSTVALQAAIILSLCSDVPEPLKKAVTQLVHVLAENKRLLIAPELYTQFEMMRASEEKTIMVDVATFSPLTAAQEAALIHRLGKRLERDVTLNVTIDPSLLGGAVIRAGDLVIDDSVRSKLVKLGYCLAA